MNFPELRDTAWASIPDAVHDDFDHPQAWGRDVQAGRALIQWLHQRADSERPFFGFLLLDDIGPAASETRCTEKATAAFLDYRDIASQFTRRDASFQPRHRDDYG